MNKVFCFVVEFFLQALRTIGFYHCFPEVFGMLIGRRPTVLCFIWGGLLQPLTCPLWISSGSGSCRIPLLIWPWNLAFSIPLLPHHLTPMAPCCKFFSTFHCWQTHTFFIQNILVSWIRNLLKTSGGGSVYSISVTFLATKKALSWRMNERTKEATR